jgi:hypothetical protein
MKRKSNGGPLARIPAAHFLIVAVLIGSLLAGGVAEASKEGSPGTLGFVSASNGLPTGESHLSIWFGDIDNDTNLDIATAGYFGVRVWTGDGAGAWTLAANGLPNSGHDGGVCLGDINNDGDLDIAASNFNHGAGTGVSVWTGDGAGTWTPASAGLPTTNWYTGIYMADVNHDDNLDLAVANENTGIQVFLGNGAGVWTEASESLPNSGGYYGVWLDDVNHDDNVDLAVAGVGMHVYLGNGAGNWTESSNGLPWTDQWNSVTLGDLNLDGHLDMAAATDQSGHGVRAWLGDGTSNWTEVSSGLPTSGTYYGVILADLVGDKYLDLLVGQFNGAGVEVYQGDGGFTWTDATGGLPNGKVIGVAAGDIDGDGYTDIAAAGENFGVQVWRNDETAPPLSVVVEEPNGGEAWDAFSDHYINWTTSGGTAPLTIRIEYSTGGLFGTYTQIIDGTNNDGTHLWSVPNDSSIDCYVRVNVTDSTAKTNWDKSDGPFRIVGTETDPPEITNLQPANQSVISLTTPTIGASYSDASGIDVLSVLLEVDSVDVTSQATVTASDVAYVPALPLSPGIHNVYLEVRDASPLQNLSSETWSFTVDTSPPAISNLEPFDLTISDNTPVIRASYDDPAGIDQGSVHLEVDGFDVTAGATITASEVTHTPPPLSEGKHDVYIEVADMVVPQNAGNESWSFTVDTLGPTITDMQPANQSIIGSSSPTMEALYSDLSSIDPATVTITLDGADVTADSIVTPGGVTYYPPLPIAEGPHTVRVQAADVAVPSNMAAVVWAFIVDTQGPVLSNYQPANGSTTGDATPVISVTYTDPYGVNVSSVTLEVDGLDVTAQATVEYDRVTYLPPSPMADGLHDVDISVTDNSSPANWAKDFWFFTIDTSIIDPDPPTISNPQPLNQSIVSDNTPAIGAEYTDISGIDMASVLLMVDGFDVTAQAMVTPLDVTYTPPLPLAEGPHDVYLEVADESPAQNVAVKIWGFTADSIVPAISNLQPADQSITNDNTPPIGASYGDDSGIDLAGVVLMVDSVDVTVSAAVGVNQVVYTPAALSEGVHDVYLEVKDLASPANTATRTWWFTVDSLPPVVSNPQPIPLSTITDTTPTISASFEDPSGVDVSSVVIYVDAIDVTASAVVTPGGFAYAPISPLSDGVHTVDVELGDNSVPQNTVEEQWTFTVDSTMLDVTPPEITSLQPADLSILNDDTPTISASFSDDSGIDEGSVMISVDALDVSSLAAITQAGVSYVPIAPLAEGSHTVYLEVEDGSTNRNVATESWEFTVDTTPPAISDTLPADQAIIGDPRPMIAAVYADDSGIDVADVLLKIDSIDVTAQATVSADSLSYVPTSDLSEGSHSVYVEVKDSSTPQNMATATWQFTVDTTPPAISNLVPMNGSTISDDTPTISATYSDASGIDITSIVLKLGSMDITGSAVVTGSAITLTFLTPLADGPYAVVLEVSDESDPQNTATAAWLFTISTEQDDSDHDGLPDAWERENFGDLGNGPDDDPDGDGLRNSHEHSLQTDPNDRDTDGDGVLDGDDANPLVAEDEGAGLEAWVWGAAIALLIVIVLLLLILFWPKKAPEEDPETEEEEPED